MVIKMLKTLYFSLLASLSGHLVRIDSGQWGRYDILGHGGLVERCPEGQTNYEGQAQDASPMESCVCKFDPTVVLVA